MHARPGAQRPPADGPLLRVFVYRRGEVSCTAAFDQRRVVIGRAPELDLVLDCDTVSRMHAVVTVDAGALVIEDLESKNGVWIAGQAVQRTALRPWEPVALGSYTLRFHLDKSARREEEDEATAEAWSLDPDREWDALEPALQQAEPAPGDVSPPAGGGTFPLADLLEPEVRPGPRGPGAGNKKAKRVTTLVTKAPEMRRTSGQHDVELVRRRRGTDSGGREGGGR